MLTFDQLRLLPDNIIQAYGRLKAERIIESAPPLRQLRYRALQARTAAVLRRVKNPYLRAQLAYRLMVDDGLNELNKALKGEQQ